MDYNNLKPGLYLQQGETIKAIGDSGFFGSFVFGETVDEVARGVSWVFVALNEREKAMRELLDVGQWYVGEEKLDVFPFVFNWKREFVRIDAALQLNGNAYLLKQRSTYGDSIGGLRWLDPSDVTPQSPYAIFGGAAYASYLYKGGKTIPETDVVYFFKPGLKEVGGDLVAGAAISIAASLLSGIGDTYNTLFRNNALPIMLVSVPPQTSDNDKETLERRFKRVFNMGRGSKENRTIGVREGVKVVTLQLTPDTLNSKEIEESSVRSILAAFDIPYDLLFGSANYATSSDVRRGLISGIAQRISYVVDCFLEDEEIKQFGFRYSVNVSRHWSMQGDVQKTADAFLRFVNGGFTPQAAAIIVGLDLEQVDVEEIYQKPEENPVSLVTQPSAKLLQEKEARQFTRWYKKRIGADVTGFKSTILTHENKLLLADNLLRETQNNYP